MNAEKLPFISVIVPVYNERETINECVESLLAQTYPKNKYEIIIVDNNSSDDTPEIIKKYPVVLLFEREVQTSYAARNKGIKNAKGDVIAFTDGDCIAEKNWLKELAVNYDNQNIGCFAGDIQIYKPDSTFEEFLVRSKIFGQGKGENSGYLSGAATANVAYRREVFDKIGMFDENIPTGADVEFSWRVQEKLNQKIVLNKAAIVYHRSERKSEYFERWMRYGLGQEIHKLKDDNYIIKPFLKDIYNFIKTIFIGIKYFPINFINYERHKIDKVQLYTHFYYCYLGLAHITGRCKGKLLILFKKYRKI
ncbi:MAG: glycosyltransferase [bacterium]|nr:glycosyltransferase [bacterium]